MARRTLHIPDPIDEEIKAMLEHGDSYSAIVQDALAAHLDAGTDTDTNSEVRD